MKDAWPVEAQAIGGRHYRGDNVDQNFDTYSVEYTFADGTKLFLEGRSMPGCHDEFASYAHGTQGLGGHLDRRRTRPAKCRIYKGQKIDKDDLAWAFPQPEPNPYQLEWDHLIDAIRNDKPYNEVKRGAEASLVTSMGRMAAHTGQVITFDEMLNCEHEFAPDVDKLDAGRPRPASWPTPTASTRSPCPASTRRGSISGLFFFLFLILLVLLLLILFLIFILLLLLIPHGSEAGVRGRLGLRLGLGRGLRT